jgi:hypothetical protein
LKKEYRNVLKISIMSHNLFAKNDEFSGQSEMTVGVFRQETTILSWAPLPTHYTAIIILPVVLVPVVPGTLPIIVIIFNFDQFYLQIRTTAVPRPRTAPQRHPWGLVLPRKSWHMVSLIHVPRPDLSLYPAHQYPPHKRIRKPL